MKKILLFTAIAGLSLGVVSCTGALDTEPRGPVSNEQLTEMIDKDADKVLGPMMTGAVGFMHNGAYNATTDNKGFRVWNLSLDVMGNDVALSKSTNWFAQDYLMQNYRTQDRIRPAEYWYTYYQLVFKSNQILDLIAEDATGMALVYKAQALTMRSMAYYYLVNLYQDDYKNGGATKAGVPLYLSVTGAQPRESVENVYTQIIDDLKVAINLFAGAGYDAKASKEDIDQTVANHVLARVLLTYGDYSGAATAADAVISQYQLMNEEEYTTSGFQELELPETIWGYNWSAATSSQNDSFASFMSATATGYGGSQGVYMEIDSRLYDQISETDYRKKNFLAEPLPFDFADGVSAVIPKYTNMKFASADYNQDEVFMRVSEMYVIKAEALARDGQASAAQQALFDLASKRDAAYVKSTATGDALLQEVFLQGRIEMWGEGYEFFANKRFNKGVNRSGSINHLTLELNLAAGKNFTFQLPLSIELSPNPFIEDVDQNP